MTETIEQKMLSKYSASIVDVSRPSWIEYFMNQVFEIAKRSPDAQTKCGTIITDLDNHPLAMGYNAPAKGLPDVIPNFRTAEEGKNAYKYKFFLHSEINAIINATIPLWSVNGGIRAFITAKPCLYCLSALINCNLRELYYTDGLGWSKTEEELMEFDFLIQSSNVKLFPQKRS